MLAARKISTRTIALILITASVTSCSSSAINGFVYEKIEDKFSEEVVTIATSEIRGDLDSNAYLELSFVCKRKNSDELGIAPMSISLLVSNNDGNSYKFDNIELKLNNGKIIPYSTLSTINTSKYYNEIYTNIDTLYFTENLSNVHQISFFPLIIRSYIADSLLDNKYNHEDWDKIVEKLYYSYHNLNEISVRYETGDGLINTAVFETKNQNVKKVFKDCGWDQYPAIFEKMKTTRITRVQAIEAKEAEEARKAEETREAEEQKFMEEQKAMQLKTKVVFPDREMIDASAAPYPKN